ncbi:MAG: MotA/TolQ/ExbB proton channel family protein [Candidatus Pacebacteria bacterium]|nr:MotA/TolQ/ExbB proton channel family protein [Candidatus Paceibacterota bacterium]
MKANRMIVVCSFCVVLALTAAAYIHAQDAPSSASAEATENADIVASEKAGKTTFWGLVRQGGWTMFPLGLLSVGAIGLTVYGFLTVQESKMLQPQLVPGLRDDLKSLNLENAKQTCTDNPSLLTNTLHAGLERISDGILDLESMEKAMEEATVHETTAGMKPVNYLSIIAQIAPMLGLLGTVSGMIKAFQKIGLGGMGQPEVLASNIGEAMITTATGLVIGIPAMFFYFYLKNKYMAQVSELARVLGNLSHQLVAASRSNSTE